MINQAIALIGTIAVLSKSIYIPEPSFYEMHATAYCLKGITASGEEVRKGICASGRREWIGKTIVLYQRDGDQIGEFIGIYECLDTGCKKNVIDVWCEDMDEVQRFMDRVYENGCRGKIYVQVIDANG